MKEIETQYEIFYDELYYGMWCLRNKNFKSMQDTLHFAKKEEADHALQVILKWKVCQPQK